MFASEANNLRETVTALRQYSENDTIDQLLGQASEADQALRFKSENGLRHSWSVFLASDSIGCF